MASEQARKAYPGNTGAHLVGQQAYDRGAVDALREIAAIIRKRSPRSLRAVFSEAEALRMADEWEAQS